MYCPHCGAENDDSNRFCVNCGSEQTRRSRPPATKRTPKERFSQLIGTTPRARLITVATVGAVAVAVIALLSLNSPNDDPKGTSTYLQRLDQECVAEKERIIALEQQILNRQPPDLQAFASVLVTSLAEWRANLRLKRPPRSASAVSALEATLLETLIRSGELARSIRANDADSAISRRAGAVDEATTNVDRVIDDLGLSDCAQLQVSPAGVQP